MSLVYEVCVCRADKSTSLRPSDCSSSRTPHTGLYRHGHLMHRPCCSGWHGSTQGTSGWTRTSTCSACRLTRHYHCICIADSSTPGLWARSLSHWLGYKKNGGVTVGMEVVLPHLQCASPVVDLRGVTARESARIAGCNRSTYDTCQPCSINFKEPCQ